MHLPDERGRGLIVLNSNLSDANAVYIKNKKGPSRTQQLANRIYPEGEKRRVFKTTLF